MPWKPSYKSDNLDFSSFTILIYHLNMIIFWLSIFTRKKIYHIKIHWVFQCRSVVWQFLSFVIYFLSQSPFGNAVQLFVLFWGMHLKERLTCCNYCFSSSVSYIHIIYLFGAIQLISDKFEILSDPYSTPMWYAIFFIFK